jgi:hypothetical protein
MLIFTLLWILLNRLVCIAVPPLILFREIPDTDPVQGIGYPRCSSFQYRDFLHFFNSQFIIQPLFYITVRNIGT